MSDTPQTPDLEIETLQPVYVTLAAYLEIEILQRVYATLAALDGDARRRAIRYLADRLLSNAEKPPQSQGGHARAAKLSAEERSAIASKAAIAHWENGTEKKNG